MALTQYVIVHSYINYHIFKGLYIYDTFPKACQMVLSIVPHYENKMEFFWKLGAWFPISLLVGPSNKNPPKQQKIAKGNL